MPSLLSVNIGLPKDVEWHGRTVHTGIWKQSVEGPHMVRRLNLDGDGQGDLNGHGGEQRAVLVYQLESYDYWQQHLGRDDFTFGQFGENFTVDGLPDTEVCIGDRYRIGAAEFEVTQPRVTCYRVGMRLGVPELPSLLVAHHRPGFYLRVITEGQVQAGDQIVRTRVGPEAISVADIDALLYLPGRDPAMLRAALAIPALSPGWQGSFRDLLYAGTQPEPAPTAGFRALRVRQVIHESESVVSVHLEADTPGAPLPSAKPGQYLVFRVSGDDRPTAVRSYSLSSAPGSTSYRVSIRREGTVSAYLHDNLKPGMVLDATAPRGDFVLAEGRRPAVLVSAGIGITPVLAMLHQLAGQASGRAVWWIHVTRDGALEEEAAALLESLPNVHTHVFHTATSPRPTAAELAALGIPVDAIAYLCGPPQFMAELEATLKVAEIRTERFGALAPINPGLTDERAVVPHQPEGDPGTGPLITFARSGLAVPWSGRHPSLLDLADACDVQTRWSCRTGVCHTCLTPLIAGEVSYEPQPLEPPPPGEVLPCCSRPVSDLVLDL
jgi:MOSC domain-containing protein YiiM/ferredoxin-NADP reductase/ferredoxin